MIVIGSGLKRGMAGMAIALSSVASAQDAPAHWWSLEASYTADVMGVVDGGTRRGARYLDNLNVIGEADLSRAIGWRGAVAHLHVLNNLGGKPNALSGSIQGIDNIEVGQRKLKLYEAWIEQSFGQQVTLRAGLYDVNSEFYQTDASALLISPMFGVGSELSATGPNGPSIFPSTALAARMKLDLGGGYAQVAVVNANAGTIGDDQGVDLSGKDGVLLIGEVGWTGSGKLAVGGWRYTRRQPEIIPPGVTIGPGVSRASGAYLIAEHGLSGAEGKARHLSGFARLGISEGKTTPFRGGWQLGLMMDRVVAARAASAASIGIGNGMLSRNYRAANPAGLPSLHHSETILEATYRDEVIAGVTVQPDVQYVIHPSGDPAIHNALVLGLRVVLAWAAQ